MPTRPRGNPRYASFLATGGAVGLLLTVVLVQGPGRDVDNRGRLFLYLAVLLVGLGALLGGLAAVLLERDARPRHDVRRGGADDGTDAPVDS